MHGQPRKARYLSDLTPKMSTALIRCHTTIVLVGDHHQRGISTPTITALVRRDLIGEGRDKRARRTWKPTHAGISLIQTEEPRFLSRSSDHMDPGTDAPGYTTNPSLAMSGEPEAVDQITIDRYATINNERHTLIKAGADQELFSQQRTLEQRLWELKRLAVDRGVNVRSELRLIERGLDAIEAKLRNQRAA